MKMKRKNKDEIPEWAEQLISGHALINLKLNLNIIAGLMLIAGALIFGIELIFEYSLNQILADPTSFITAILFMAFILYVGLYLLIGSIILKLRGYHHFLS